MKPRESILFFGPEILSPKTQQHPDHYSNPYVLALKSLVDRRLAARPDSRPKEALSAVKGMLDPANGGNANTVPTSHDSCPLSSLPLMFSELDSGYFNPLETQQFKREWLAEVATRETPATRAILEQIASSSFNIFITTLVDSSVDDAFRMTAGRKPRYINFLKSEDRSRLNSYLNELPAYRNSQKRKIELINEREPIVVKLFGDAKEQEFIASEKELISFSILCAHWMINTNTATRSVFELSSFLMAGLGLHRWFKRLLLGAIGIFNVPKDENDLFPTSYETVGKHTHFVFDSLDAQFSKCARKSHLELWLKNEFQLKPCSETLDRILSKHSPSPTAGSLAKRISQQLQNDGELERPIKLFFCHASEDKHFVKGVAKALRQEIPDANVLEEVFLDEDNIALQAPRASCLQYISQYGSQPCYRMLLFVGHSQHRYTTSEEERNQIEQNKFWPREFDRQKDERKKNIAYVQCEQFVSEDRTQDRDLFQSIVSKLSGTRPGDETEPMWIPLPDA
jgi:hypothetical protein